MTMGTTLAVDLGGTKLLACTVRHGRVLEQKIVPTPRDADADAWIGCIVDAAAGLGTGYDRIAIAVTGAIEHGRWSALNPGILPVPDGFPLEARLREALRVPVLALNDAQAAAWGEFRFGAGQGCDSMVFLTISTGLGGGIVLDGALYTGRSGLAGSLGQIGSTRDARLEDELSGQWMAREAERQGHRADAVAVAEAARRGEAWAETIIETSASRVAALLADLQLILDPERCAVGGGVGLSPGYLQRIERRLGGLDAKRRPHVVAASLGAQAGVLGAADLAESAFATQSKTEEVG